MIRKLLEEAFKKAEIVTGRESVNARAAYLAEVITEEHKYPITPKSLYRYYQGETTPKKEVMDSLSVFLGYENYEGFILRYTEKQGVSLRMTKRGGRKRFDTKKTVIAVIMISLISLAMLFGLGSNEDCIVWVKDRYEAARCTGNRLERPYSAELLDNFEKVEVNSETSFFKSGNAAIWYDKSDKKLEFFTAPGIHPTNGKTLKPITQYMINKYIKDQEP